jgi:hypothetical protein
MATFIVLRSIKMSIKKAIRTGLKVSNATKKSFKPHNVFNNNSMRSA